MRSAAGDSGGKRPRPQPSRAVLQRLIRAAHRVRARAYAPYSKFLVGAAVLDDRGRVYVGCNVENASYGLTVCAERNAIATAVAAGARRIQALVVVTAAEPPASPCGACRQVLAEFAAGDAPVYLWVVGHKTPAEVFSVVALLPRSFRL